MMLKMNLSKTDFEDCLTNGKWRFNIGTLSNEIDDDTKHMILISS